MATDHLNLNENWALWRSVAVRGAGFPIKMIDLIVADEIENLVVEYLAEEVSFDQAILKAKVLCGDALRAGTENDPKPLRRALRRLGKRRAPDFNDFSPGFRAAFQAVSDAMEAHTAKGAAIEAAWPDVNYRLQKTLRDAAANPTIREAVAWQNWPALRTGFDTFLSQPSTANNSDSRRRRALVARYLQRYCTKNETIGFFGPISWGKFSDSGAPLKLQPGPALLVERKVHLEFWAINALADAIAADPTCRLWLRPRLSPLAYVDGDRLLGPYGISSNLNAQQKRFLKACDGKTDARTIARKVASNPRSGFVSEAQVDAQLRQLTQSKTIIWRPATPFSADPEDGLRAELERIKDKATRNRCLSKLDALVNGKEAIAAANNPDAIQAAFKSLEQDFETVTGRTARRHGGRDYTGRTLVYEDCRRDLDVEIGPEFIERLKEPLSLVLESARWFVWRTATQYNEFLEATFTDAQQKIGRTEIDLDMFWSFLQKQNDTAVLIVEDAAEQLTENWSAILSPDDSPQQHSASELRDRVLKAFASPPPPLWEAGHHSPDLMIAAESEAAINRGDYLIVLGEVHAGGNSLMQSALLNLHPKVEELIDAQQKDNPAKSLRPAINRNLVGHRLAYDPPTQGDMQVEYDDSVSWRPPKEVLKTGSMVVERTKDGLLVRTRDGKHRFPALAFFGSQIRGQCARRFRLLPQRPHTPRITIDRFVLQRESWRFPVEELGFASLKTPRERYLGARRWAFRSKLPRWVFVRVPGERKPIYLDFQCPDLIELIAKFIRAAPTEKGQALSISEMLPNPNQTWLADAEGNRYTSELRIIAVDRTHAPAIDVLTA